MIFLGIQDKLNFGFAGWLSIPMVCWNGIYGVQGKVVDSLKGLSEVACAARLAPDNFSGGHDFS
jgi:hypothetical protein